MSHILDMRFRVRLVAVCATAGIMSCGGQTNTVGQTADGGRAVGQWVVDSVPAVSLGGDGGAPPATTFAQIAGASQLPDGSIIVGDVGPFAFRRFSADGKELSRFGGRGRGPGEVDYLLWLYRCGERLFAADITGERISIFTLEGAFVRAFRFESQGGHRPYRSACNRDARFVHYGWDLDRDMIDGVFRSIVPFWISDADSIGSRLIGRYPGSERFGARPLPLGKESAVAIGRDRVYVGTAESPGIRVFTMTGDSLAVVFVPGSIQQTTADDVDAEREREVAMVGEKRRTFIEREYVNLPLPKVLPAYRTLIVDRLDYLWVQTFPRPTALSSHWTVFSSRGSLEATVELPVAFEPLEIGSDYVLGRYLDPGTMVPQIRRYAMAREPVASEGTAKGSTAETPSPSNAVATATRPTVSAHGVISTSSDVESVIRFARGTVRLVSTAQANYWRKTRQYTSDLEKLQPFALDGELIQGQAHVDSLVVTPNGGWYVIASHPRLPGRSCVLMAAPAPASSRLPKLYTRHDKRLAVNGQAVCDSM